MSDDYSEKLYDAAIKLVDAMGHHSGCSITLFGQSQWCDCGAWDRMATARGELIRLLRNDPQPPSSTD